MVHEATDYPACPDLNPHYCRGTGAYCSEVAEFCASTWQPDGSFTIARPRKPLALDAVAWIDSCPQGGHVRIHEGATIYRDVSAVLAGRGRRVNLLLNSDMGTFVELDTQLQVEGQAIDPDQFASAIVSPLNAYDRSTIVCLVRHKLLNWYGPDLNGPPTNRYRRECSAYFDSSAGKILATNAINGRAYLIRDSMVSADTLATLREVSDTEPLFPFLQTLCEVGILRRIAAG